MRSITMRRGRLAGLPTLMALALLGTSTRADDVSPKPPAEAGDGTVSFDKQVRPIFQAHCQGCHQPAKAGGAYVMTDFARLAAGGESGLEAIIAGRPDESHLLEMIAPVDGEAEMPRGQAPLAAEEVEVVRRWIAQGAADDTPPVANRKYDPEHPPVYSRPPVITSIDFAPDGSTLAVAGFHEVLLWKADGSELLARLIGLSERIESVRFSPDGSRLAVTGGLPGRMGEVQVWDSAKRTLTLSVPVTADTVYGASWSPDGARIAFGCGDNSVRAIDAKTGEQVLFMGSHNDWALDTVFSTDGSHLISVGRDMTAKLTEVATQRFIDNLTSITPGALKGGLASVARHPDRDEIVVGGSDGVPKIYRAFRVAARAIGDDSNLIRELPALPGRVFGVVVSRDGRRVAACSSLDGAGQVSVGSYEFDTTLENDLRKIMEKRVNQRSEEEQARVDAYRTDGVRVISTTAIPGGVYAVAFRPDGAILAAAGADGSVRLIDPETGTIAEQFVPVPLGGTPPPSIQPAPALAVASASAEGDADAWPDGLAIAGLEVEPAQVRLATRFDTVQLVVTARTPAGEAIDATRMAEQTLTSPIADISRSGLVRPRADGKATLRLDLAGRSVEVPVSVAGFGVEPQVDFVHDVNPILSRLGCNQGTCHGSAQGKNGFKLSLRGYDPIFDVRALTDDHASRRVNVASPDASLMLVKTTGSVPHVGGVLMKPGEPYYEVLRNWIAGGARLESGSPRVVRIEVFPHNPVVQEIGARQQLRVLATYAGGEVRDVTREAFLETGNAEVATADRTGLMTAIRRGEAPVLARFEGAYAATTLTVMGDRDGFVWEEPPVYNRIDELAADKWERLKIRPSEVADDAEFLRRVHLDLTGLPPSADAVRAFLADDRESRVKREEVVDRLIGGPAFIDYWTNKWADLLQVNRKFLEAKGAVAFRDWIREKVAANTPYDQFVRAILTAEGSNRENPPASYFKILREPAETMENTTQLFLAVRFNCNKCHDHPFERWTQDQYYETAAYFARVGLKKDPAGGDGLIGGTAVEGGKPLFEIVEDRPEGEVEHVRTGKVAEPEFPFACDFEASDDATRRERLAAWITSTDNPYFARSYVNRLWGYLLGVGIIEPIDDIRAGNPPTNPELLDYLTDEFLASGFDARRIMEMICKSRTYQLSVATNEWNEDDRTNYAHATARRLPAEVLLDAVYRVTGSASNFPGVPEGTRAAALPDSGVELPSGFLSTFGRPARESACECERSSGLQLGPVMALVSGPTLGDAIADPKNDLAKLVTEQPTDEALVREMFLRILNRPATRDEVGAALQSFATIDDDHRALVAALDDREAEMAPIHARKEAERVEAIEAAESDLASYEAEVAPETARLEQERVEAVGRLEKDLKGYEAGPLTAKVAEWESKRSADLDWAPLAASALKADGAVRLERQADRSIVASGKDVKTTYTITAPTDLRGIRAIRLEAIADEAFPKRGPGRAPDGNFVLTEIEVEAAPKSNPKAFQAVKLQNARADFEQDKFGVEEAIDGSDADPDNGWAASPALGVTHWATFEAKEPVGFEGGTVLRIQLHHRYKGNVYSLGRFRISVAAADEGELGLGLSEELAAALAPTTRERTRVQSKAVLAYVKAIDPDHRSRADALAKARKPLPTDPGLVARRDRLEEAREPVPIDPGLAQLRRDAAMSREQLAQTRLTAAQDLAWALINSTAFLFNH